MSRLFLLRLCLDGLAAALLLFALSYWWLGNLAHEAAGAVLFALLAAHNIFNRRWYGRPSSAGPAPSQRFNVVLTFVLLAIMLALLVTSVMISQAIPAVMPFQGSFSARQIHACVAYWALVIVSVHIGLRWPMVMVATCQLLGIRTASLPRVIALRAMAAILAACGIWSGFELGLPDKLLMRMTLDWWDFENDAAGFFMRCVAVSALFVSASYYGVARWRRRPRGLPRVTR